MTEIEHLPAEGGWLTRASGETEVAWHALENALRIDSMPGDVFEDIATTAGRPLDYKALDLACVGSLAQMGFSAQFAWWTAPVRVALDRIGSL